MHIAKMLLTNISSDCHQDYLWNWVEARGFRVLRLSLQVNVACIELMDPGKLDQAVRALNGQTLGDRKVEARHVVSDYDNVSQFVRTVA
jgi:hypothetical protein